MRNLQHRYQQKFNRLVRAMNKDNQNDDLWRGRFVAYQKEATMECFSDGSGGILHSTLRLIDKKTGYYKDYLIDYAPYLPSVNWHLFEAMNKFITEDTGVWDENPSPRDKNFIRDYRNVKIPKGIMGEPFNWFVSYEYWDRRDKF